MKFGVALPVYEDPTERDPYRATYDVCAAAEEAGFDVGLVGHHHFTPGYASAPFVLLAAIAARTERLRLGTGIFLLPVHHPLAIAEQVATLDRISGGRAVLGVGVGYRPYEYEPFGVAYGRRGDRMTEAIEVIRAAWTGHVEHDGEHFTIPALDVVPTPVQQPGPPIWVGAVARRAQDRAARLGDAWLSDLMQTLAVEQHLARRYRDACAAASKAPEVVLMRNAAIAPTRAALEERWLPGVARMYLDYWRAGARGRDDEGVFRKLDAGETIGFEELVADRAIAGSPEDCRRAVERCHEMTGCDRVLLALGAASPDEVTRSLELFGREVIAAFPDGSSTDEVRGKP